MGLLLISSVSVDGRDMLLALVFFFKTRIVIPALLLHGVLVEKGPVKWLTAV